MEFFKQRFNNECQIIALKCVLSHFEIYPTTKEIKSRLPKHGYGNTLEELQDLLKSFKINSKIFKSEQFEIDLIKEVAILNVDWNKIAGREGNKSIPHYVVLLKDEQDLWLYDGSNQNAPISSNVVNLSQALIKNKNNVLFIY